MNAISDQRTGLGINVEHDAETTACFQTLLGEIHITWEPYSKVDCTVALMILFLPVNRQVAIPY